jgi:hypothetical protein
MYLIFESINKLNKGYRRIRKNTSKPRSLTTYSDRERVGVREGKSELVFMLQII